MQKHWWLMRNILATVLLSTSVLLSAPLTKKGKRYTLYAKTVQNEGNCIVASDGIVIYNKDSTFSADKAIYDQKKQIITLSGNVVLFFQGKMINKTDLVRYDLKHNTFITSNVFIKEADSDIWIRSKKLRANKKNFYVKSASLSSCPSQAPDWQIKFSSAHLHKDKSYVSLYNPRFYLGKVPVLYLPWIAFPTIHKRKSGLLKPIIGFENSENLLFMQPIFIAPSKSWDIQLNPQVRLNRGLGLYSTFRFADSPYSKGHLTLGVFDEKKKYASSHNLKNSVHKGASFYYENEAPFTKFIKDNPYSYKDGLLIDITTLNDIDYVNLKDDNKYAVDKLITSKLNYYVSGYQDYFGAYAKYFIDTEKISNKETLQTLPSLQYHKFSTILGMQNFLYTIDYKFKNSYRREGLGAHQHEISLPFVFTVPLFKNYLNLSMSENLYFSHVSYTDANSSIQNARYLSNYHQIALESDLLKPYQNSIHNIQLSLALNLPSFNREKGYFADFIPFNLEQKSIIIKMNNYLYNLNGTNYLIDRFVQRYFYDKEFKQFNQAENEVIYQYSNNLSLRNALIYSYEFHKLKKIQSGVRYNDDTYNIRLDHTYNDAPNETKINFFSGDFLRVIDKRYSFYSGLDYDLDHHFTKEWRIGLDMHKKCWSYQLRYKESVTPSLTSGGTESITKRGIYLMVRFAHIGGVNYKYVQDVNTKVLNEDGFEPQPQNVPILKPTSDDNVSQPKG